MQNLIIHRQNNSENRLQTTASSIETSVEGVMHVHPLQEFWSTITIFAVGLVPLRQMCSYTVKFA